MALAKFCWLSPVRARHAAVWACACCRCAAVRCTGLSTGRPPFAMVVTYMSAHGPVNNTVSEHHYIALALSLSRYVLTSTKDAPSAAVLLRRCTGRLARHLRALGDRLFFEDDAQALRHGWQIQSRHAGLSRIYRDPRFDQLAECPDCHGRGSRAGFRCTHCSATGRIHLGQDHNARQSGGD